MICKIVFFIITYGFIECVSTKNENQFSSLTALNNTHFAQVEQSRNAAPLFLTSYLPAVMQAVAYYIEQLQYVQPPIEPSDYLTTPRPWPTTTKSDQKTTRKTTTSRTTTKKVTTTTTVNPDETSTPKHNPGYYSPERPPTPEPVYLDDPVTTTARTATTKKQTWWLAAISRTTSKPLNSNSNAMTVVNIEDEDKKQFFTWFFKPQAKAVPMLLKEELDLQLLDPLPKELLNDINKENFEPPAQLDDDNLLEFRKNYDDALKFGKLTISGKKRVPPTEPYVKMLLLYDLLKREAKALMLNKYVGYSKEMLDELKIISKYPAVQQLHHLLKQMLERKDTTRTDIIERTNSIITDLENPNSISSKAIREIPALIFCEDDGC